MEKSIEQILDKPANMDDIIRKNKEINARLEEIDMPELDEETEEEYEPDHYICGHCEGNGCYICNYSGELYR